ncbi:MAG: hypoxanthine phosphoribosyltransferase [Pelodictyon luteolum]|uniref:Hypoxanthine phosphoribosyltransferase n=1 Tax=Pelodictyon luteolum TaxID=1100 RepID=A0A165LGU8_PELLU|nr:hypoxanthine phosphoribosyltransferase [Pelodictyon luteolum]KZK74024.1 MAG: hypoxanthine phosphoribosyltransferase [Pelodictyon luteolum]
MTANTPAPRPAAFITAEAIARRVAELGSAISEEYPGATTENPLAVVAVMKGAFIFAADLVRAITIPCTIQFISASSYGSGTKSSGNVALDHDLAIGGKNVLIIEDIVDTGLTILKISEAFKALKPASIRICTLLDKPAARIHPARIDHIGFKVPDRFLIGYGIDWNERFRELPYLAILED